MGTSKIAYVRVSSRDQNTGRQIEALKSHNIDKIFEEKVSGKDMNRPELIKMLDYVRDGDVVYVESFSRLARNMLDLLKIVEQLKEKKVGFVSLKENINTTTPEGCFQLNVFGAMYQFEREVNKARQREGILLSLETGITKTGKPFGRPRVPITDKFLSVHKQWKAGEIKAIDAMKLAGVTKTTFYSRVKELEQQGINQG